MGFGFPSPKTGAGYVVSHAGQGAPAHSSGGFLGGITHAISGVSSAVGHATGAPAPSHAAAAAHLASLSSYRQQVVSNFLRQSHTSQFSFLHNALTSPSHVGNIVLDFLHSATGDESLKPIVNPLKTGQPSRGMGQDISAAATRIAAPVLRTGPSSALGQQAQAKAQLAQKIKNFGPDPVLTALGGALQHSGPAQGLRTAVGATPLTGPQKAAAQGARTVGSAAAQLARQSQPAQNLRGLVGGPVSSPAGPAAAKVIGTAAKLVPAGPYQLAQLAKATGLADPALKAAGNAVNWAQQQGAKNTNIGGIHQAGVVPSQLITVPVRAAIDIGRAAVQQPSVIPKTITGLGTTATAAAAALAQLPIQAARQGPGTAVSQLVSGMAHDYSKRYGPLTIPGGDKAFIDRIKQQGAAPEVLDLLGFVGGADATAGRAVTHASQLRAEITGHPNFFTRTRPVLRTSGNDVRTQALAKGAMKITAQRAEDKLRQLRGGTRAGTPLRQGEVAPLFPGHAQRVLTSQVATKWRQLMQDQLNRHVRLSGGAEAQARKLSRWERTAMPVAVEGWLPLREGPTAVREMIDKRMQMIREDRLNGGPTNPGNRIAPGNAGKVDELALLEKLENNAQKWATPRLAAFVDKEAVRSAHLEEKLPGSFLRQPTAEARRLRAQGEMLGIPHPQEFRARYLKDIEAHRAKIAALVDRPGTVGELHAARDALHKLDARVADWRNGPSTEELRNYSKQVRDTRPSSWHEPAYIKHDAHPRGAADFGSYTTGMGAKAMGRPKQSQFINWRAGVVDRRPQAYFDSLARTIRGAHQWRLVDEQFRRNHISIPQARIREALGQDIHPADLTGFQSRQVLEHMGADLNHVRFYNPGRLSEATLAESGLLKGSRAGSAPHELTMDAHLADQLGQHDTSFDPSVDKAGRPLASGAQAEHFHTTTGWKAVPAAAYKEIHAGLTPSGQVGRWVGKIQGAMAGTILGGSPSFVVMNSLAHLYLSSFGTRGRIFTDAAKFPLWWHGLSDEERALVRAHAGGRGMHVVERMGSQGGRIAQGWAELRQKRIMRYARAVNPLTVMFKAEDLQSNFFRHMTYYHELKRVSIDNLAHDMGPAAEAMHRLVNSLTTGPKDEMARLLRSQAAAEEVGRYTVNMMGDYARFTSFERKWINNRAVLFYSFLRHATRTLLYVLPVKHPIATALVAEMGKLHKDEVDRLLFNKAAPWDYGRVFFDQHGRLTSIDMMRASPIGGAAVDVSAEGIKGAARLLSPELQIVLDAMYGQSVSGQKKPSNVFTALNDFLSLSYPYRLAKDLHFGTKPQSPSSIPFLHERPLQPKTAAAQAYQAAKAQASGPLGQKVLGGLLGAYPKPDPARVIAWRAAQAAKSKAAAKQKKQDQLFTDPFKGGLYTDPFSAPKASATPPPLKSSDLGGAGGSGLPTVNLVQQAFHLPAAGQAQLAKSLRAQGVPAKSLQTSGPVANGVAMTLGQTAAALAIGGKQGQADALAKAALGMLGVKAPKATALGQVTNPAGLTVKGSSLNAAQLKNLNTILGVARDLKAPPAAVQAALYAAMGESSLGGDPGIMSNGGVFQTTGVPSAYSGGTDVAGQARGFFTGGTSFSGGGAIALAKKGAPAWQIANQVEANAVWNNSRGDSYGHQWKGGQAQALAEVAGMLKAAGGAGSQPQPLFTLNQKLGGALQKQVAQQLKGQTRIATAIQSIFPPGAQIHWSRADQGRDAQALVNGKPAPIIANGHGVVLSNGSNPGGFGTNYPIVHFTSGPWKGLDIYFGHTNSQLQPGQHFSPGQVISKTGDGTGSTVGNATGIVGHVEVGLAPGGSPGHWGQALPPGLDSQSSKVKSGAADVSQLFSKYPVDTSTAATAPSGSAPSGSAPSGPSGGTSGKGSTGSTKADQLLAQIAGGGTGTTLSPQQLAAGTFAKASKSSPFDVAMAAGGGSPVSAAELLRGIGGIGGAGSLAPFVNPLAGARGLPRLVTTLASRRKAGV